MAYETEAEWKAAQPDLTKITNPMEQRVALESWQTARPGYVNPMDFNNYESYAGAAGIQSGKDAGNDLTNRANFYGMTIENYQNALSGDPTKPMGGNQAVYGSQLLSPLEQRAAEAARGQGIASTTLSPEMQALAQKYPNYFVDYAKQNPDVFNAASQRFQNYLTTTYPGTLEYESVLSGPMQFSPTGVKYPETKDTVNMYILDPRTKQYVKNPNYRSPIRKADGGLMSLAGHMASKGRGPDSMLIHMSPSEVQGLQALAMKHGGSLTINPETGLPEAGFLDKLLPTIIGAGLTFFGGVPPNVAAMIVGGIQTARTGSLMEGVKAGVGAYGGADLTAGLTEAGASTIGAAEAARGLTMSPELLTEFGGESARDSLLQQQVTDRMAAATPYEKLSSGFDAFKNNPTGMAKSLATPAAMAFGPAILAGANVQAKGPQTTTKPGMIRPYSYDPYGGTYTAGTPYEATPIKPAAHGGLMGLAAGGMAGYGDGDDVARRTNDGMAQGGMYDFAQRSEPVVRMASGGIAALAGGGDAALAAYQAGNYGEASRLLGEAGMSAQDVVSKYGLSQADAATVAQNLGYAGDMSGITYGAPAAQAAAPNYDQIIADAYGTIGRSGVGEGTNQIDQGGYNHFLNMLQTGQVAPDSFNDVFQGAVSRYITDNPNDRYTQYVNDFRANQSGGGGGSTATTTDTTGGLTNLAAANNITNVTNTPAYTQYGAGDIQDYIRTNNLTGAGLDAAIKQFNADPTKVTEAQNAASIVNNIYRNVLGRDADPAGLNFWTNEITSGRRTGQEMYADFLKSAKSNTELGKFDMTLDQASTPYKGYMSTDTGNIVDEWVRNTLGREVTDADRQQKWYKDASDRATMTTYDKARDIYSNFQNYASKDAAASAAKQIADAKTLLSKNGLTEMDVLRQTGKTIAELVGSGMNLNADLMKASQLLAPGKKAGFDFSTIAKPKVVTPVVTTPITYNTIGTNAPAPIENVLGLPPGVSGAGITTVNPNGTITTRPNIPGIPEGGFTGMTSLRKAYTDGGGSLGYLSPTYTKEQFKEKYEDKLTGGSKQSYDYLTGKTPYDPTPYTKTGEIMKPYWESVGRFPENRKAKKYVYVDGKYQLNPDYVKPAYVLAGEKAAADKAAGLTNKDAKPTTNPGAGNDWVWNTTDSKWEAKPISENTTSTNDSGGGGGGEANGGLMAMAGGGMPGQFNLGDYSDGGRLLRGPGDGVSDSIPASIGGKRPARLADGEFVVPARIVSELGNGSTEAGARKLYAMMDRVQAARKGSIGKGRVAKNSRSEKYLPA